MYTTEFSCYSLRPHHSKRIAFLAGLAITAFVFYAVNLYLGDRKPKQLKGTDIYFLLATLLFVVWAVVVYFVRRFRINIYGDEKKLSIEINDKELIAPIVINYPFIISKQYIRRKNGNAYIKELFLTFMDNNNTPMLTLKGSLGDLREVPSRFGYIDISNPQQISLLNVVKPEYTTKVKDIEDVLQIHLNYMYSKNPTAAYNIPR